jgi:hypothetical protein
LEVSFKSVSWTWWYTPIIPIYGTQKQEDHKFEANLDYIASSKLACSTQRVPVSSEFIMKRQKKPRAAWGYSGTF